MLGHFVHIIGLSLSKLIKLLINKSIYFCGVCREEKFGVIRLRTTGIKLQKVKSHFETRTIS
jgi:hypothetical protein